MVRCNCRTSYIFYFTFLAFTVDFICAYPTGAPVSACASLTPSHGFAAQTSASPFTVTPRLSNYGPNSAIEVNISATAGNSFKGFILQVRVKNTQTPVGIFSVIPAGITQTKTCSQLSDTVTHTDRTVKSSLAFSWTAPSRTFTEPIEFVGTFVQSRNIFWVNVKSTELTDACNPSPCLNDGVCFRSNTGGHYCQCSSGFSGTSCEVETPCQDDTCGPWGTQCLQSSDPGISYVCVCNDGSYAFDTTCPPTTTPAPIDLCNTDPKPCLNGGSCIISSAGQVQCYCVNGYRGTNCELSPDPCDHSPCFNGATCVTAAVGYSCTCDSDHSGLQCQYTYGCSTAPCMNGGSCENTGEYETNYSCTCNPMYTGVNCETEIDPCSSSPCGSHGLCNRRGDVTGYTCLCIDGYSGATCEIAPPPTTTSLAATADPCEAIACLHGGTCVTGECRCLSEFGGELCEQDFRPLFINCPEGETLTYPLDMGSNAATIDIGIQATDYTGLSLSITFLVGPNISGLRSLEFSQAYAAGQSVIAQAKDNENRAKNCSFVIQLEDHESPAVICPSNIVELTTDSSKIVTWSDAEASDNVDEEPVVTYSVESGSSFVATGQLTSIIVRATDSSSNYNECTFTITLHKIDYDCDEFPAITNGEATCQVTDQLVRQCTVSCESTFLNTVGEGSVHSCVSDSRGSFWDPVPNSDVCTSPRIGTGIQKTASIAFDTTSFACLGENESFKSAVATNITDVLESYNMCTIRTASACGSDNVDVLCFNQAIRRRRNANISKRVRVSRRKRQIDTLIVDIDIYSSTSGDTTQLDQLEDDVDAIADGITRIASNGSFTLTLGGQRQNNNPSGTQVDSDFKWSCDQGQVTTSSGCATCPRGTYYNSTLNICFYCPRGMYQDAEQKTSCIQCAVGSLTDAVGSASIDNCIDKRQALGQLTQTHWILIYVACGVVGGFIVFITLVVLCCCCCQSEGKGNHNKNKDPVDRLTYLNRAFEDDLNNGELYGGTLGHSGSDTLPMSGHATDSYTIQQNGDNRLIEIPSDPAYLYAEVPVTSFTSKGYDDNDSGYSKSNGYINSISASIDMDIPDPPMKSPPPPPPSERKIPLPPADSFPPPPPLPGNYQFSTISAPPAPPPPPPPPTVPNSNNSHSVSPYGSTSSGRRTKFQI